MDSPNWELAFPSTPSIYGEQVLNDSVAELNCTGNMESSARVGQCNLQPATPISLKSNASGHGVSPIGGNVLKRNNDGGSDCVDLNDDSPNAGAVLNSASSETKFVKKMKYPKVFLPKSNSNSADLAELHSSVHAKLAKQRETYICIHDVAEYVSKKVAPQRVCMKWRHFNENHFLFNLQDRVTRDRFAALNRCARIGDSIVVFSPWLKTKNESRKPCNVKVWLRLTGLPVELFNYNTAQYVVTGFGRLYKCNMERNNSFIGCFYVLVDCPNIEDISPRVDVETEDDEYPVYVEKLYACPLDVYNMQKFADSVGYDEVISILIDRGKLIPLNNNKFEMPA